MATIYDVSQLAGVSLATVSRVMNKNTNVSEKTRQKVLDAMDKLGYRPNTFAQSLASNCSNSVGVLVSQLDGPYYGPMMAEIEASLRLENKHVIIAVGHSDAAQEKDSVEFLLDRGCDALILDVEAVSDEYLINLSKGPTSIVLINRYIEQINERCIYLENELGGYMATRHLISQGHRNIAYISGPAKKHDAIERLVGHKRALSEVNVDFDPALCFEGDYREEGGVDGMTYLLQQRPTKPFTAVVCANDQMVSGAISVCLERGMYIPQDLSFVGFDNIPFARYVSPKLTTVNNPIHEMGKMAALWLLKNLYNKNIEVNNVFMPELVERESSIPV
ncbi:LacI family DNA-binding transcriptional regulator [Rheinheimera sp. YQF-2]|jgi:LacI family transcriptional regulator|uniref:LacI family DNA-binding transcriptional regulator n=1 Tax=Rheinheimera lutimaris TaxID=2740584 RepID=A0A7Y5ANQ0_9GAMM|nr:LacI family DNA-binding transcriptional regulator [Rheinheimera lutimaris]NRQ41740.1 LacI family DNA-binding transcriptional regulator [Rheinheimera lutimaris]